MSVYLRYLLDFETRQACLFYKQKKKTKKVNVHPVLGPRASRGRGL